MKSVSTGRKSARTRELLPLRTFFLSPLFSPSRSVRAPKAVCSNGRRRTLSRRYGKKSEPPTGNSAFLVTAQQPREPPDVSRDRRTACRSWKSETTSRCCLSPPLSLSPRERCCWLGLDSLNSFTGSLTIAQDGRLTSLRLEYRPTAACRR